MNSLDENTIELKNEEIEYIKKYRLLDSYGKETVNITLDREAIRLNQSNTIQSLTDAEIKVLNAYRSFSSDVRSAVINFLDNTDSIAFLEGVAFAVNLSAAKSKCDINK